MNKRCGLRFMYLTSIILTNPLSPSIIIGEQKYIFFNTYFCASMGHTIIISPANNAEALSQVFEIRKEVFVREQGVSEREEYDEFETSSAHCIAYVDEEPAGTCRYRNTEKGIKLERFAVLKKYRGMGVGRYLVQHCLAQVDQSQYIYLHAQIQVVDFYSKFGFEKEGNQFEEAGIKHYKMRLKK
jgi:predicted GNAT family N-acyltransferase